MEYKSLSFQLDLAEPTFVNIKAKQGETGVKLNIELIHNTKAYAVDNVEEVNAIFSRPNNKVSRISCVVEDGVNGEISVILTNQVLAMYGKVGAEIQIKGSKGLVKSWTFPIVVEPSAGETEIESSNELSILDEALRRVEHIVDIADDIKADEDIRKVNEDNRVYNEDIRVYNEDTRVSAELLREERMIEVEEGLTAHKEDISTSRQQDNLKIAKVEKELNDYKGTIANVNVNQEVKQRVSGYGVVSLPKNSANGQVSVSVKGRTYTNLLGDKGSCESLTGWTQLGQNISVSPNNKISGSNSFRFNSPGNSNSTVYTEIPVVADKYYLLIGSGYISSYTSGTFSLRCFDGGGFSNIIPLEYDNAKLSQWQKKGLKFTGKNGTRIQVGMVSSTSSADVYMDEIMLVEISANDYNLTVDELLQKYPYINSTKSTISASRLKSVGKNLFDGKRSIPKLERTLGITAEKPYWSDNKLIRNVATGVGDAAWNVKLQLKPNTKYKLSLISNFPSRTNISLRNPETGMVSDISNSDGILDLRFYFHPSSNTSKVEISNIQLEEGTVTTPYEPYQESIQYLPNIGELRSLPNGTKDEIRVSDGKAELVKRNNEVVLNGNPNWTLSQTGTNTYRFMITGWTIANNAKLVVSSSNHFTEHNADMPYFKSDFAADDIRLLSIHGVDNNLYIRIEKAKIDAMAGVDSIAKFKAYLNQYPITLTYQLAEPIITPIQTSGNLISYPSGKVYVENVVADAGIYTSKFNIKELQLPIKSIDKLIKYNFETGVQTVLDTSLALISEDKKSFTHPNLTDKDMVFVDYFYDVEGILGETTIEYLDSRHTIKDSVNNKFYSWDIKSTNGVPTVVLTEVL